MYEKTHAFIAIHPPKGLISSLQKLLVDTEKDSSPPEINWSPWYKYHLTLFFWPALSFKEVVRGREQLAELSKRLLMPSVKIRGFSYFEKAKALYLNETSSEIHELYRLMASKLTETILPGPEKRESFIPHWTIARKFHPAQLKKHQLFFQQLDSFSLSARADRISFFITRPGWYSPQLICAFR